MSYSLPATLGDLAPSLCRGSNLAFALFILPRSQRDSMRIFYAFCRMVDDIADESSLSLDEKKLRLDVWRNAFSSRGLRDLPSDLRDLIHGYHLDLHYFLELMRGVESDFSPVQYATFEELKTYCWRVASTVGLISIRIFGCTHPHADRYAESAGMALQITNILRDVGEDLDRDRIYLPLEDMAQFGLTENDIRSRVVSPNFLELMEFEARRAGDYFDEAARTLPQNIRKNLPAAELMQAYYSRLLGKMTRSGFRVFDRRYRLSLPEKLAMALRIWL